MILRKAEELSSSLGEWFQSGVHRPAVRLQPPLDPFHQLGKGQSKEDGDVVQHQKGGQLLPLFDFRNIDLMGIDAFRQLFLRNPVLFSKLPNDSTDNFLHMITIRLCFK